MNASQIAETVAHMPLDGGDERHLFHAAVYVHFPFCRHMCTYCDFDTFTGLESRIASYIEAAASQIALSPAIEGTTLYVGGGTPSIMEPLQARRLVDASVRRFGLTVESEITIEANPTDMTVERLSGFREAGYNRLSVGVQSVNTRLLRLLGRRHSAEDAAQAIRIARGAGFGNISVDLIYGVPMQDLEIWRDTLARVVDWGVDHLSCYMLTVEPGTPMERGVQRGTLVLPADEDAVAMYEFATEYLASAGYHRYEISNWAKPGRESEHNLTYWRNQPYLGIGAGAAGYFGGLRYKARPNVGGYIEGVSARLVPLSEREEVDLRREMSETLILGLRLDEGVSLDAFRLRFGAGPDDEFGEALDWAESMDLLERASGRIRLTEHGVMLSNELFERLL